MSEWDETDTRDAPAGEHQEGGQADHQTQVHDGFNEQDLSGHEDGHDEDRDVEAVYPKKKGLNPKIIAGVMGLIMLVVVGVIGFNLYKKMSKPKFEAAALSAPVESNVTVLDEVKPATVFDNTATPGSNEAQPGSAANPVAAVAETAAIEPASALQALQKRKADEMAAAAEVTAEADRIKKAAKLAETHADTAGQGSQTITVVSTSETPAPSNGSVKKIEKQVSSLESRMTSIETSVNKLTDVVKNAQSSTKVAKSETPAAVATTDPVKHARTHHVAKTYKTAKKSATKKQAEKAEPAVSTLADSNLVLRGVYPPQGEDRQAWILNQKSGVITVVSKGTVIDGATVVRIDSDRITTSKGVIR